MDGGAETIRGREDRGRLRSWRKDARRGKGKKNGECGNKCKYCAPRMKEWVNGAEGKKHEGERESPNPFLNNSQDTVMNLLLSGSLT